MIRKALLLSAAPLLAALRCRLRQAQDKVVNVYNWSDYIDPNGPRGLHQGNRHQGRLRRLRLQRDRSRPSCSPAAPATTSSCRPTESSRARSRPASFQKLDKSKLPNLANMWDAITERLANYDPGNEYAVNYMWGTDGIGYNVDKIKERSCPTRRSIPGTCSSSRRTLPSSRTAASTCSTAPTTSSRRRLNYLGLEPGLARTRPISQKAGDLLKSIRPYIQKFHSSEYINALANGDICLAIGYSGDILQARDRADGGQERRQRSPTRSRRKAR